MGTDVLPQTEDGKVTWGENMLLKFPPAAVSVGFDTDDEKAFLDDVRMMIYDITATQSAQAEAKAWTAFKKQSLNGISDGGTPLPIPTSTAPAPPATLVEPGVIPRIRENIQRIKISKGFTDALGEQLQIMGTGAAKPAPSEGKPKFEAFAEIAAVILKWIKGEFDGVVIECRRGAETTYTLLDKDFKSPFTDTRPNLVAGQPEKRRYRMIYLLDDAIVGTYSDEVVVTTMA